jgi:hypothetical protein
MLEKYDINMDYVQYKSDHDETDKEHIEEPPMPEHDDHDDYDGGDDTACEYKSIDASFFDFSSLPNTEYGTISIVYNACVDDSTQCWAESSITGGSNCIGWFDNYMSWDWTR